MYDKIDSLLPVFFALTSNVEATKRLMLMKYMFEDQLNALQQNKYVINLDQLSKLREQFSGYFSWVRNTVGAQSQQQAQVQQKQQQLQQQQVQQQVQPPQVQPQQMQSPQVQPQQVQQAQSLQQTNPVAVSQPLDPQQQIQQQQIQQPQQPVQGDFNQQQQQQIPLTQQYADAAKLAQAQAMAQVQAYAAQQLQQRAQNPSAASTPNMGAIGQIGIKRGSIDLKLPPNKKQKAAGSTPQQTTIDLTQTPPPPQHAEPANSETIVNSNTSIANANPGGMTASQRQTQSQMIYQAAISSGIPPQIVKLLPPRALQCSWLLQQAAQNRINVTPQQQQQIRNMLNERVEAAKQQLARQAMEAQQQQQSQAPPPVSTATMATPSPPMVKAQTKTPDTVLQQQSPVVKAEPDYKNNESLQQAAQMMHLLQQQQQQQQQQRQQPRQPTVAASQPSPVVQRPQPPQPLPAQVLPLKATVPSPKPTPGAALKLAVQSLDSKTPKLLDIQKEVERLFSRPDQPKTIKNEACLQPEGPLNTTISKVDEKDVQEKKAPTEEDVLNSWYEVGLETGVPEVYEIMPGFSFDDSPIVST